jgi:hypothetical protein
MDRPVTSRVHFGTGARGALFSDALPRYTRAAEPATSGGVRCIALDGSGHLISFERGTCPSAEPIRLCAQSGECQHGARFPSTQAGRPITQRRDGTPEPCPKAAIDCNGLQSTASLARINHPNRNTPYDRRLGPMVVPSRPGRETATQMQHQVSSPIPERVAGCYSLLREKVRGIGSSTGRLNHVVP